VRPTERGDRKVGPTARGDRKVGPTVRGDRKVGPTARGDSGHHHPLYKGGCHRPSRRLGLITVAHDSKFLQANNQEPTVSGSFTAVDYGG
jgi:hypothetical protein